MSEKKKIAFYCLLSSGHFNVCVSLAKAMLDQHSEKVEIYFVCDKEWEKKLRKIDNRFKLAKFEYETKEAETRMSSLIDGFKKFLNLPQVERLITLMEGFMQNRTILEIDIKVEEQLKKISPDFLLFVKNTN